VLLWPTWQQKETEADGTIEGGALCVAQASTLFAGRKESRKESSGEFEGAARVMTWF
jgi:hypothetical protein